MNAVQPFATATWSLVPRRTAVVVIDMQNDFLHSEGWYAQSSLDISHMQAAIGPTRTLVVEARARGVPIIWTRHGFRDERDAGVFMRLRPFLATGGLRKETWGYNLIDGLGQTEYDWFIEKSRLSAFYNTNLGACTSVFGRRDDPFCRGFDESVRRCHLEGRKFPRLQTNRRT